MTQRRWNWLLWAGFLLCIAGLASLQFLAQFPITRDVPWVNFSLFAAGLTLLVLGLSRAFGPGGQYRGKIAGPILATLSLAIARFFGFIVFYQTRQLPASSGAPRIGQKAPEFTLTDTHNQPISLSSLLSTPLPGRQTPPKGVVLIFYRGYW